MTSTTFISKVTTIATAWLQDVNDFVYSLGAKKSDLAASSGSASVGYIGEWAGAVATTLETKNRASIRIQDGMTAAQIADVRAFGYSYNFTSLIASALAALPSSGGTLVFDYGGYSGTISGRRNNWGIQGAGEFCTILKNPAGALSVGGVIEVGDTASGNSAAAYTGFTCHDITIDGNRAAATAPTDDLKGHGIILTKITGWNVTRTRVINAWNAGLIPVITSNNGHAQVYIENCGNASHTAPGFDINSSAHITFDVVSKGCQNGARILDNCWDINGRVSIYNAVTVGFVANDQSVNESHGLNIDVTVEGGCTAAGVQVGTTVRASNFRCAVANVTGVGVQEVYTATAADRPIGNNYKVATKSCQLQSCLIGGDGGNWDITSYLDGRSGAAGTYQAVLIDGQRNNYTVNVTDSATPQIRGVKLSATSVGNKLVAFTRNTLVSDYNDLGTGNTFIPVFYRGSATYDAPNLAAGAQTSTTITVTGCDVGRGDMAEVRYDLNIGGVTIYAEVTATNTVTAWLTNQTAAPVDLTSATIYALVLRGQA